MAKNGTNDVDVINIISAGTVINGDLKTDGVIRLNGKLIGNIETSEKLVIGLQGYVQGDILCNQADIEGKMEGTIVVKQLLSLKSTANIQGDIETKQLLVEPGAIFTGTCKMSTHEKTNKEK